MSRRVLVVGGGPGGYTAAERAAEHGAKVVLFERERLGGTCGTWGCIPTKTLFTAASAIRDKERLARSGLAVQTNLDFKALKERMRKVVESTEKGVQFLMDRAGVEVVRGEAKADIAGKRVECAGKAYEGDAIILATGTTEGKPGIFNDPCVWTSRDLLQCDEIPESMVVVGGGAVGAEFACIYCAFGTKVTLVEMLDRIVPAEDADISKELARTMKKAGVDVRTGACVESLLPDARGVVLADGSSVEAQKVLLAVGRRVLSDFPGLAMDGRFIKVDGSMQTSVPGVYAVGDITGGMMLAHKAVAEGRVAGISAAGGNACRDWHVVPGATFTLPEIASAGMTEELARKAGPAHAGKFLYRALGKGLAEGHMDGFAKVVADGQGRLVGCHILGHSASDLIPEAAMAIENGLTVRQVADSIHAHPTLPEVVQEACRECARAMGKTAE